MNEYTNKLMTANEAASRVKSGDRVYVGTASSFAYDLLDALWERRDDLEDVTILCSMALKKAEMFCQKYYGDDNPFKISTYFLGSGERIAARNGMPMDYTSFHLSQLDLWCREVARPDICFLEVSRPDSNGYMSYGPTGCCLHEFLQGYAREIYVESNIKTPFIHGDKALIHVSQVDGIVETDNPVSLLPDTRPDEISEKIANRIIDEIPDGATIQLGIGGLSTAIGYALKDRNDLGIYTELFTEPMMYLMKNGNVTNMCKGYLDGISVFGFAMGTEKMYEFMDNNPLLYGASFPFINDSRNIAKNKKMISVNTAMSLNLYGEVAADSLGYRQQSGVGGQIDYVKGSQWSEGGKSFIALSSTYEAAGEIKSKICVSFPEGTAITTPRSEVQYVATEYGIVNLKTLTMRERVKAIISLAHPSFRDSLTEEAKAKGIL